MSTPTAPPLAPNLSGRALDGRYELHALIGEGAFGRVYRGRDKRLARAVAVKVIKPWWAEDPDWIAGFEREAQLMARISNPGIVQIFDVGYAPEGAYYVAELVEGESLAHRLRLGPLALWEASDVAEQLCRALGYAHAQRIVHCDVKPANVLISREGKVKVGDFGVARLAEGTGNTSAGALGGTPKYMAPEQARGGATTPATDVYSAGVVLYEMLAGRAPFSGGSAVELALRHLSDVPPALDPAVPAPLTRVVAQALAKDPAERYADGQEMAEALSWLRGSQNDPPRGEATPDTEHTRAAGIDPTLVVPPTSPRRNVNPAARRRSIAMLTSGLLLLFGMVLAAIMIGGVGHLRVPDVRGMTRAAIGARARRLTLHPRFASRYSDAPRGTAIEQSPSSGTRVPDGSILRVVLSAGPAPVAIPSVVGVPAAQAQAELQRFRLQTVIHQVPAPGSAAGLVTSQAPQAGTSELPGSMVSLSIAETPRWRDLTSFTEPTSSSVPFKIRGLRWRIVYRMSYQGTCTFIIFCSGPSAQVTNPSSGNALGSFDLNEGDRQVRTFDSGPGLYEITVTPGSDTARWSVEVQDYY